jgi:hypothetical protein
VLFGQTKLSRSAAHLQTLALISFCTFTDRIAKSESEWQSGEMSAAVVPLMRPLASKRVHLSMPPSSLLSTGPLFQLLDMARFGAVERR